MSTVPAGPKLVLGLEHAGMALTPGEFDALEKYDTRYRYELIQGVLVVSPIPRAEETDPNEELGHLLRLYQKGHPEGKALDKSLPQQYVYTRRYRRLADRLLWAGLGRLPDLKKDLPTVVVEFVSRSRRDRQRDYKQKRKEYAALKIPEYWIIDRFRRTLTVVLNEPGGPREVVIAENDTYTTPRLPGFALRPGELFAVGDAWSPRE